MVNPLLKLSSVSLHFGGLKAISQLSLEVPTSGIYGIIGPNGAGKSSVFNLITGLYKATYGKIFFESVDISDLAPTQIARLGIARTFQNIRLLPQLTVLENLKIVTASERTHGFWNSLLGGTQNFKKNLQIKERAEFVLELVGLKDARDQYFQSLPYGDQRRLEIARALMRQPRLLLLDEPAAGMTALEKDELREILQSIRSDHLSIVIIEHDMKFIMNLCDHITVLNQGAFCARGTPKEIQTNPAVIESYLGNANKV